MYGVVGDAVEDIGPGALCWRQQARKVDPAQHSPAGRIDAGDAVGHPHVGVDFAVDEFEFVELVDSLAAIAHRHAAQQSEGVGVAEEEGVRCRRS